MYTDGNMQAVWKFSHHHHQHYPQPFMRQQLWSGTVLTFAILIFTSQFAKSSSSPDQAVTTNIFERRRSTNQTFRCAVEIKNCIEPITSKVCSGHGACVCGECACFQTEFENYYGRFCEHCGGCPPNLCEDLKPCVECRVHSAGRYEKPEDCNAHCSRYPEIQIAEVASSDEKDGNHFCTFTDDEGCEYYFIYGYAADNGDLVIVAERDKECPERPVETSQLAGGEQPATSRTNRPGPPPVFINVKRGRPDSIPSKILNTKAFDLMLVCGLVMTTSRNSERTTQLPQHLQRNGIHFDMRNCEFVPKSEPFLLSASGSLLDSSVDEAAGGAGKNLPIISVVIVAFSFFPWFVTLSVAP